MLLWKAGLDEGPLSFVTTVKPSVAEVVKTSSSVAVAKAAADDHGSAMKKEVRENNERKFSSSQRNVKAKPSAVFDRRDACRVSIVQRIKSADYFVSRIANETTVEEVEGHTKNVLGARNVNVNCQKLKTKSHACSSFYVKVTDEEEIIREVRCLFDGVEE